MHGQQGSSFTDLATPGAADVAGGTLSEAAASYLAARLAQGLVVPASAHDHTTVNEPDAAAN
ncbi:hypothetical protein [Actinomadura sp. WMMA1423]|uniref:hypothetical protein n=1 Tax=Actinomadura sp. WMMA1423 TaxID=2591108 RepID=UPI001147968D|nr:hypothetical protein [Actinomadura sp. WMMA1423]